MYWNKGKGNTQVNRKSVNPSSEVCFMSYSQTPLVPTLKSTISNPVNLVEGVADKDWVRGGIPSREYVRTDNYTTNTN